MLAVAGALNLRCQFVESKELVIPVAWTKASGGPARTYAIRRRKRHTVRIGFIHSVRVRFSVNVSRMRRWLARSRSVKFAERSAIRRP